MTTDPDPFHIELGRFFDAKLTQAATPIEFGGGHTYPEIDTTITDRSGARYSVRIIRWRNQR